MAFTWNTAFSVNHKEIDLQHKKLFEIIKHFHLKHVDDYLESEEYKSVYDDLLSYAKEHFSYEEEYLRQNNYPYLSIHKKKHEGFVDTVIEMKNAIECDKKVNYKRLVKFLKEWVTHHIYVEDKMYANYIEENSLF